MAVTQEDSLRTDPSVSVASDRLRYSEPQRRTFPWMLFLGVALTACVCAFLLPFAFKPSVVSMSAAYVAGFNNKIASVALALVSLAFMYIAWKRHLDSRLNLLADTQRMPRWLLLAACVVNAVLIGIICRVVFMSGINFGEAPYQIERLQQFSDYHKRLYVDFDYPYGPLLFFFPVAIKALLAPLHLTIAACYYVALILMEVLGVGMLFYIINALPISRSVRWVAFLLFASLSINLLLGSNYTFFRFAMPLATLLFAVRRKNPYVVASLFGFGEILQLATSPELGIAFAAGACSYGLYRAFTGRRIWLWATLAPIVGAGLYLAIAGRSYLAFLAMFAGGSFNFVIEPVPHIFIFLFAFVWLVPLGLVAHFRRDAAEGSVLAAFFITSLALVPAALGRCDPIHVFMSGLGIFLLSLVAISGFGPAQRKYWLGALAFFILFINFVILRIDIYPILAVTRSYLEATDRPQAKVAFDQFVRRVSPHIASALDSKAPDPDTATLKAIVGQEQIATPIGISLQWENALKRAGLYRPEHYSYITLAFDAALEQQKIDEMNRAKWALVLTSPWPYIETPASTKIFLGVGFNYPERHTPYVPGSRLYQELDMNWSAVTTVGPYTLYRNKRKW